MDLQTVMYWSAAIIAVGGALTMLWKLFQPLAARVKKMVEFLDLFTRDWFGEPASSGRDAVPGVMARLNKIDGELQHNGGSTMKDAMKRVESKVDKINERIERGDKRFLEGEKRFEKIESELDKFKRGS